jgi:uracil-DNA glycosylase family 4
VSTLPEIAPAAEPSPDCPRCPRLVAFREALRAKEPGWFNSPVGSFGPVDARLLIVGLAPGLQGANRTGRPFTGDYAGVLLYDTLKEFGFARGDYQARPDDGLTLIDARISNAVRCVPPENKPTPQEINTCRDYLAATLASMPRLAVIVSLGRIAHDSVVRALGARPSAVPFGHGACHQVGTLQLLDSYHCSRYNTNTGVLTPAMFQAVFRAARAHLDGIGKAA